MLIRLLVASVLMSSPLLAQDADVENPTSNNRGIEVLPAPGAVVIDGKDSDWDLTAGIWSYNNPTLVNKYGVWTHMMWDDKGIYLLMRYTDSSPMKNTTRGKDFHKSWQADAFQGRVVFDENTPEEHQMHINAFYSSFENKPYLIVHHGGLKKDKPYDGTGPFRQDQLDKYGNTMEAFGGKVAYEAWADGKGYNMETFWPWTYIRTSGKPMKAGDSFVFGLEAMWGSNDGSRLEHRLVDSMKDDSVNRIFFFRAKDGWGKATLAAKGKSDVVEKQKQLQAARLKMFVNYDTVGSIPIGYELPDDRDVTIAIDSSDGKRVRNLFGQYPRSKGANKDLWDGLDDSGNPVPAGDYTATVVDHQPISVKFYNNVYNSATPPWPTADGIKTWGSNHGHPTSAATRGEVILLGFTGTEGSSGIMRVDANGKILWTDVTESLDLTLDDKYAYLLSRESWTKRTMIRRFNLENGDLVLFENEERSTESVLPVDVKETPDATIAFAGGKLYGFVPGKSIWKVNPASGKIEATLDATGLVALENYKDGLYGLFSDGRVAQLDTEGKVKTIMFTAAGLSKPARLAISQDGQRFAISDHETNQVFFFDPKGKKLSAIGQPYQAVHEMRPAGKFVENNLIKPLGLAFDSQGRLWVAEAEHSCRRITCWTPDGKLEKQFWGSADYGAMFGFAITYDSTRFMVHGIEFQLDPNPDIMNKATQEKPLMFHPALAHGDRGFIYKYKDHEYAMTMPDSKQEGFAIAKRGKDGVFIPVVVVDYNTAKKGQPDNSKAWIDKNENGKEDAGETTGTVKGTNHYWTAGWVTPELVIFTADQYIYRPTGFTGDGVPLYDFSKAERPAHVIASGVKADNSRPGPDGVVGTFVMDKAGNITDGLNFATADGRTGSYPSPYGRHDAPAARRGLMIAPFRTNGVVEGIPGIGSMTALGGDRGEWFLMSMDGLFISSILQDSKSEVTLDETFTGQESFGGFIWRDEKGRVLVQLGGNSFRLMEIKGLETVRKTSLKLAVTDALIQQGMKIAQDRRKNSYKEPETLTIAKLSKLPNAAASPETGITQTLIDGAETARIQESGDPSRWFRVAMAQDGKNLAISYQVNDANPWKNGEGRFSHAFIGGDVVDLKLDVPGRGPIRVLGAPLGGENTVVYWQKKAEKKDNPTIYAVSTNEANAQNFDVVKRLSTARIKLETSSGKYSVLLTVPLEDLGIDPAKLKEVKGVAGVIFSDPTGSNRTSRLYWHDKETGLVSDVPTEARLDSSKWGTITLSQ